MTNNERNDLVCFLLPVFRRGDAEVSAEMICKITLRAKLQPFTDILHIILSCAEQKGCLLQPLSADIFVGSQRGFPLKFFAQIVFRVASLAG